MPCGCSPAACNYSYLLQLLVLQPHLDASSAAANPFGSKFTHAAATPSCYNYFCCIVPCGCSPAACKCFYLLQLLVLQPHLVAATASAALCPVGAHQQHATTSNCYCCLCCNVPCGCSPAVVVAERLLPLPAGEVRPRPEVTLLVLLLLLLLLWGPTAREGEREEGANIRDF